MARTPVSPPTASITQRTRPTPSRPRRSTESWSSTDDEPLHDWESKHVCVLLAMLERAPSHLATPYVGAIPPSNLLDTIAREILETRSMSDWPHSLRATRQKLIQVAKKQARLDSKSSKMQSVTSPRGEDELAIPPFLDHIVQEDHSTLMELDTPPQPMRMGMSAMRQRTPLYRRNSMDFLPIPEEPGPANRPHIPVPATPGPDTSIRDRSVTKMTGHASFHPYKRTMTPRTPPASISKGATGSALSPSLVLASPLGESILAEDASCSIQPPSLSAASSATLLSSMASRTSLSTATSAVKVPRTRTRSSVGGTGNPGVGRDTHPASPITPRKKRTTRSIVDGNLQPAADVFRHHHQQQQEDGHCGSSLGASTIPTPMKSPELVAKGYAKREATTATTKVNVGRDTVSPKAGTEELVRRKSARIRSIAQSHLPTSQSRSPHPPFEIHITQPIQEELATPLLAGASAISPRRATRSSASRTTANKTDGLAPPMPLSPTPNLRRSSRIGNRDNVPPIVATRASSAAQALAPVTLAPVQAVRPRQRALSTASGSIGIAAPPTAINAPHSPAQKRGKALRRVGGLGAATPGGTPAPARSNENRIPQSGTVVGTTSSSLASMGQQMQPMAPSPMMVDNRSVQSPTDDAHCSGGAKRPRRPLSTASDWSERSGLSGGAGTSNGAAVGAMSARSGRSGLSAMSSIGAGPSAAARFVGRKISFGSDNANGSPNGAASGLMLHHGVLGNSGFLSGMGTNTSAVNAASVSCMLAAPFELQ